MKPAITHRFLHRLVGCLALVAACSAAAQESADSRVDIAKLDTVQITGLEDWLIAVADADDELLADAARSVPDSVCVHSTTGKYSLDISTVNGGSPLYLVSSAGDQLNYRILTWSLDGDGTPSSARQRQVHTTPVSLTNRLASLAPSCAGQGFSGNTNLRFRATVNRADFNAAAPGIYQDTVVLTVSPE